MQRAAVELTLLSLSAGILGSWIVLRRLAFFAHAVGPVAFPALTVAQAASVNPQAAAIVSAAVFAVAFERMARSSRVAEDAVTGLVLVGGLALGAMLASDLFTSSAQVDSLLFGSVLTIGRPELLLALVVAALTILCMVTLGRSWLVAGFDPATASTLGVRSRPANMMLLLVSAVAVAISVFAVGALLVSALFVIPAATVRLIVKSVRTLVLSSVLLAAGEGIFSIWLAYQANLPTGAALALTSGALFFLTVVCVEAKQLLHRRIRTEPNVEGVG